MSSEPVGPEASWPSFNIHEAKTQLSRIVDRVEHGEEIIISRAGHPVAKVIPLRSEVRRTGRGSLKGMVLPDDWDSDQTNAAIAADFAAADIFPR